MVHKILFDFNLLLNLAILEHFTLRVSNALDNKVIAWFDIEQDLVNFYLEKLFIVGLACFLLFLDDML